MQPGQRSGTDAARVPADVAIYELWQIRQVIGHGVVCSHVVLHTAEAVITNGNSRFPTVGSNGRRLYTASAVVALRFPNSVGSQA